MSSHASECPPPAEERVEAALQRLSIEPTSLKLGTDGTELEVLSHDDGKATVTIVENQAGAVEQLVDAPVGTEKNESRAAVLSGMADIMETIFPRRGTGRAIQMVVAFRSLALLLTPDGHAERQRRLATLGDSLNRRFNYLGDLADIDKAIQCLSQALLLTPDGPLSEDSLLNNLGSSYSARFERLGDPEDLDQAIQCLSQALLTTPNDHPLKPIAMVYNNLGMSYVQRFDRLGNLADLDKAIEYLSQAVLLSPDGHPDKLIRLSNLGISYQSRFDRLGQRSDIDRAIEYKRQAVLLTPDGAETKPDVYNNLGNSYLARFKHLDDLEDIDEAIGCLSQAVLLTPDGHPRRPSKLGNLGISHMRRFTRLGNLEDIDKAIECQSQAVLLTLDGHADKPAMYQGLGNSYMSRFRVHGYIADIDKAIECQSQAVLLTPDDHADKSSRLSCLGTAHRYRYDHLGRNTDIEKAIECLSQAVLLMPENHANKPRRLSSLGNALMRRFHRLSDLPDINKAIECLSQAVLLIPDGHPDKPACLDSLGFSYCSRFRRLGELEDINKAIECSGQAVLLTPDGHAAKPGLLSKAAVPLMCRFERLDDLADVRRAQSYLRSGAQLRVIQPRAQLACALGWAKSSVLLDLSPKPAYERCMELVPHMIWLGTTINQRYSRLALIGDLATEAAAWAISVQSYDLAIEWLEQGRSVVWNQLLQLRTPFDELYAVDPALAGRLKHIASQLEASNSREIDAASSIDLLSDLEKETQQHHRLATEWEQLLGNVHSIPGFQDFMLPRKAAELKLAATDGPVVLINTHSSRCDALIILPQSDDIVHLGLDSINLKKILTAREQLDTLVRQQGDRAGGFKKSRPTSRAEEAFEPILAMLWSDVVSPVLDILSYTRNLPIDELPHLTWCTTGALSFLPLHAAGLHGNSMPKAFDFMVSSYTPTLGALLAIAPKVSTPTEGFGVLGVGQEHTQGFSSLPSTVQELTALKERVKAMCFQQLDGTNASVEAVLNAMDQYSWVHLACHASQNPANPAHSAFHLSDGPLTLEKITKKQFTNKGLAFLSACQTATGDDKLPDESVHLAAGMLVAGYPSVICTMWSIYDEDAPGVAGEVYAELLKDGKMDHRGSARALHKAVATLRAKVGNDAFKRWVPFIHIGM